MTARLIPAVALASLPVLTGAIAAAAAGEEEQNRALVASCLACHDNPGAAPIPGWPPLKSMRNDDIAAKLRAYRDGQVPDSRMSDVAHNLSDEEIRYLADFYGR